VPGRDGVEEPAGFFGCNPAAFGSPPRRLQPRVCGIDARAQCRVDLDAVLAQCVAEDGRRSTAARVREAADRGALRRDRRLGLSWRRRVTGDASWRRRTDGRRQRQALNSPMGIDGLGRVYTEGVAHDPPGATCFRDGGLPGRL
jgi:IS5 family transposase